MPSSGSLLSLAAVASTANAAFQGFNYGATFTNGALKAQSDFEAEFKAAASLEGTDGAFNSGRLYTMIQGDTANDPISAIPAAISTKTSLLFGLWASAGEESFNNEIAALQKTIDQYCDKLDGLVAGISVGSEDLYRNSPTGIGNGENPGTNPETLADYISQVRKTIKGTCLSDAPIGHVDTWTAYANSSNQALIEACDWLGMDAYAYFEDTKPNGIENGASLFKDALEKTKAAAGDREVWITETGWPVSGKDFGDAVASKQNARTFWKDVGCPMFGSTNVWWYTLQDSAPDTPNPSFGVIGSEFTKKPLYDLSCDGSSGGSDPKPSKSPTKPADPEPTTSSDSESTTSEGPVPTPSTSTSAEASSVESQTQLPGSSATSSPTTQVVEPSPSHELPTTYKPVPIPTVSQGNGTVPTPSASIPTSLVPTASGGAGFPGETTPGAGTDGGSAPTQPPSSGSQLNSFGAAAVAVILAVGLL